MKRDGDDRPLPDVARLLTAEGFPPLSATVQVEFGAHSCRGKSRPLNEDHYLVMRLGRHQETLLSSMPASAAASRFEEFGYATFVADGISAGGDGEAASRLAIVTLVYLVRQFGRWDLRVDDTNARDLLHRAERFLRHVDGAMVQENETGAGRELQTTLTATFGAGRELFFAHVGHSRAYLLRDGRLLRLTRDHTLSEMGTMHRRGRSRIPVAPLVDVSTAAVDLRHILTDAIGMTGTAGPQIDLERFELLDRDIVLVCSNGLTDVVDEDVIAGILSSGRSPDELSRTLVDLAMESGGDDDATAVVAQYHLPEPERARAT